MRQMSNHSSVDGVLQQGCTPAGRKTIRQARVWRGMARLPVVGERPLRLAPSKPVRAVQARMACNRPLYLQVPARSQTTCIMLGDADLTSLALVCGQRRSHRPPPSSPSLPGGVRRYKVLKSFCGLHARSDSTNLSIELILATTPSLVA